MSKRLFVAGIPFTTTSDELKNLFSSVGNVISATVITDRETGRSKGFGFVEMEKEEDASKAIATLNKTNFGGRELIVAEAKPQIERHGRFEEGGGFKSRNRSGGRNSFGRGGNRGGNFRRSGGYHR